MPLSDGFLQELRDRCDIFDVVSGYVSLKRTGGNYVGLCPFHNEKTPSFTVSPDKQIFHCFGCGAGGNVITFLMKMENLDFKDAVTELCKRCGMEVEEQSEGDASSRRIRERLYLVNKEAARYYHGVLMGEEGKEALSYLKNRGLSLATIKHFGLGYSKGSWDSLIVHLKSLGFSYEEMSLSGLTLTSKKGSPYDRFRSRVMFPIIDIRGNVIGFGGRIMSGDGPKYLNSPETPVFNKSYNLFAMNIAKKKVADDAIILAEGYMDVIALHQAGFENAVASLGTSLTKQQAKLISRHAKKVIIAYDSDGAGTSAAQRAISILSELSLEVKVIKMVGAKDPDEYIRKNGKDKFKMLLSKSENYIEYQLLKLKEGYDLADLSQRVDFINAGANVIAAIDNPIERDIHTGNFAKEYEVSKDALDAQIKRNLKNRQRKDQGRIKREALDTAPISLKRAAKISNAPSLAVEEELLKILFDEPGLIADGDLQIDEEIFVNAISKKIFAYIKDSFEMQKEVNVLSLPNYFDEDELSYITGVMSQRPGGTLNEGPEKRVKELILKLSFEKKRADLKESREVTTSDLLDLTERKKKMLKDKNI